MSRRRRPRRSRREDASDSPDLRAASEELRTAMKRDAARLADLMLKQPPLDLLAYLWSLRQLGAMLRSDGHTTADAPQGEDDAEVRAALEYAHAIFSCFSPPLRARGTLNESDCADILRLVASEIGRFVRFNWEVVVELARAR